MQTLSVALPTVLDQTLTRLRLLKYTKGAIMRVPELREQSEEWWERERRRGEWIREDEGVRKAAERVGYGFDEGNIIDAEKIASPDGDIPGEGRLRTQARKAANMFVKRFPTFEETA
jgi:predicted phage gp36 major capsid-like protein